MKLFFSLPEERQDAAINYCTHMTLHDLIDGALKLEPIETEENEKNEMKHKFDEAMEHIKTLPTVDDKMDFLMSDEDISRAIFEIAVEMAKTALYVEEDEFTIDLVDIIDDEKDDTKTTPEDMEAKKKLLN